MDIRVDKCEWCSKHFERAATGRKRRFCSTACRVAHHRSKQVVEWEPVEETALPDPTEPVAAALSGKQATTDEQVCAAILTVSTCEITLTRLGREARPELGWRCALLAEAIATARREYFEGVLP